MGDLDVTDQLLVIYSHWSNIGEKWEYNGIVHSYL